MPSVNFMLILCHESQIFLQYGFWDVTDIHWQYKTYNTHYTDTRAEGNESSRRCVEMAELDAPVSFSIYPHHFLFPHKISIKLTRAIIVDRFLTWTRSGWPAVIRSSDGVGNSGLEEEV